MNRWAVATILSADSNGLNSLEELILAVDQEIAYVQQNNRFYRWDAASTETPDGAAVVIRRDRPTSEAGRWIRFGFPGPGKIPPGFSNRLSMEAGFMPYGLVSAVSVGGAPSETLNVRPANIGDYTGVLWTAANAVLVYSVDSANPLLIAKPFVSSNGASVTLSMADGSNVPAAITVTGGVLRVS